MTELNWFSVMTKFVGFTEFVKTNVKKIKPWVEMQLKKTNVLIWLPLHNRILPQGQILNGNMNAKEYEW